MDLFDPNTKAKSMFIDKEMRRWTVDDYRHAMENRSQPMRNFTMDILIRYLVESPAFLSLSPRATKLYIACVNATWVFSDETKKRPGGRPKTEKYDKERHDRPMLDCARFYCPYNYAKAFGVGTSKQIHDAFVELKAFQFIRQHGVSRRNAPNVYEHIEDYKSLTWNQCQEIKIKLKKGVK